MLRVFLTLIQNVCGGSISTDLFRLLLFGKARYVVCCMVDGLWVAELVRYVVCCMVDGLWVAELVRPCLSRLA